MLSTQPKATVRPNPICLSLNANYQSFQLKISGLREFSTKKHSSKHKLSKRQQHNAKHMLVSRQQCQLSSQSNRRNTPGISGYLAHCTSCCGHSSKMAWICPHPNLVQMLKRRMSRMHQNNIESFITYIMKISGDRGQVSKQIQSMV